MHPRQTKFCGRVDFSQEGVTSTPLSDPLVPARSLHLDHEPVDAVRGRPTGRPLLALRCHTPPCPAPRRPAPPRNQNFSMPGLAIRGRPKGRPLLALPRPASPSPGPPRGASPRQELRTPRCSPSQSVRNDRTSPVASRQGRSAVRRCLATPQAAFRQPVRRRIRR